MWLMTFRRRDARNASNRTTAGHNSCPHASRDDSLLVVYWTRVRMSETNPHAAGINLNPLRRKPVYGFRPPLFGFSKLYLAKNLRS